MYRLPGSQRARFNDLFYCTESYSTLTMGCCCCKSPDIELLKQDPSIQVCAKTTMSGYGTFYKNMPNVALKQVVNNMGGDVVYVREDRLGHISCCSCCEQEFPLKQMTKVERVKNQLVHLGGRRQGLYVGDGVLITFEDSENSNKYTQVVFSAPEAEQFFNHLSRNAPSQEKFSQF